MARLMSGMIVLAVALAGAAQAKTMQQKLVAACADDMNALCPGRAPDSDTMKACMLANRARVSAPCMRLIDASE